MDYISEILSALRVPSRLVRLTLAGPARPKSVEWKKVVIRPVKQGGVLRLYAVRQGERREERHPVSEDELDTAIRGYLAMGFRHIDLQRADGDLHVRITKKGKALVSRGKPSVADVSSPVSHDRSKTYPFPEDRPEPFLETLGVMRHGRVLPSRYDKFRQINHFLMLLAQTGLLRESRGKAALRIVDAGCGLAFLTFAAHHFLAEKLGLCVETVGVDAEPRVIAAARSDAARLGVKGVDFAASRILDYAPSEPPDIVLSLHACDTATDEAIAQGVKWGAQVILAVPCCQHELRHALQRADQRAVLRHGILRERTADIVTDALRAAALRVMGYKADVIEFISPGHTAKNLMLRAEQVRGLPLRVEAADYLRLRDFWGVKPKIEELLGAAFEERVARR